MSHLHQNSARECRLIQRNIGGWIALSASDQALQIGVIAPSRDAAIAGLEEAERKWREILSSA